MEDRYDPSIVIARINETGGWTAAINEDGEITAVDSKV